MMVTGRAGYDSAARAAPATDSKTTSASARFIRFSLGFRFFPYATLLWIPASAGMTPRFHGDGDTRGSDVRYPAERYAARIPRPRTQVRAGGDQTQGDAARSRARLGEARAMGASQERLRARLPYLRAE